jgi:hypothetical protein
VRHHFRRPQALIRAHCSIVTVDTPYVYILHTYAYASNTYQIQPRNVLCSQIHLHLHLHIQWHMNRIYLLYLYYYDYYKCFCIMLVMVILFCFVVVVVMGIVF